MTKVGLDIQPSSVSAINGERSYVGRAVLRNTRPRIVMLESGIKALVEVVGLADIESVVDAVLVNAEDIDASCFDVS